MTVLAPAPTIAGMHVAKTMQPGRPGTIGLLRRFGASLVLVRYRYDWTRLQRYTTVELLVAADHITRGHSRKNLFAVRLGRHERHLVDAARDLGASWNPQLRCWTMPGHVAQTLDLVHRIDLTHDPRPPRKTRPRHPPREETAS